MKRIATFFFCIMLTQTSIAQLEKRLDSLLSASSTTDGPGIALHVENNGKLLYQKGFGLDNTGGKRLSKTTNFRMASVSKQFTAMSVVLLENAGKLSYNDPIGKYFPELPSLVGNSILIRHLINHTSGIIDYENLMPDGQKEQILDAGVLDLLKTQDTTYFKPGSQFRYSNSGYAMLALLTERVSGKSFPAYMQAHIFKPLKMNKSLIYDASANIPNRSLGFARRRNGEIYANDQSSTSAVKGDGGVYTSLTDYNKWIHGLWDNRLTNLQEALQKLNSPIKDVTGSFYGPGWFYFNKTQPSLFHSGSTCGFSTFSINIPEQKTSIVFFSNLAGNTAAFKKILDLLATEGIVKPGEVFELHELTR